MAQEEIKVSRLKTFFNHKINRIIAVFLCLGVVGITTWLLIPKPADPNISGPSGETSISPMQTLQPIQAMDLGYEIKKPFELIAEDSDDIGIGIDTGYYILLTDTQYSIEELKERISIDPQTEYTLKKVANNDFLLKPTALLKANKVYSIAFKDTVKEVSYSWAFQTRNEFFVTSTLPRHQATFVPVNTGVEITFSLSQVNDLTSFFDITPKVEGRFEVHKSTVVFVPTENLQYDTIYTVTVKSGFGQYNNELMLKNDTVFSFQTEPKPDQTYNRKNNESLNFVRSLYNLYPDDMPFISIYSNLKADAICSFELYRYSSEEAFQNDILVRDDRPSWCAKYEKPKPIEGKELVLSTNGLLQSDNVNENNHYSSVKFFSLPAAIPEGYYVAVIKNDNLESRTLIQVNAMAVYVGSAVNKSIGMVYDSQTGLPVEGAVVQFEHYTMTTGADGIAASPEFTSSDQLELQKNYAIKREGHPTYYARIGEDYYGAYHYDEAYYGYYEGYYSDFSTNDIQDEYWGYLFSDRGMYQNTDTINIWGLLSGKDGNAAPKNLKVIFSEGYYNSDSSQYNYSIIDETEVVVTSANTFKTELSYENLNDGYYYLSVVSDDRVLLRKGISITNYTKPIYILNTSLDKNIVTYNEPFTLQVETKFFEGTPVNGMNLNYYVHGLNTNNDSGILTTDIDGKAEQTFSAKMDVSSWQPQIVNININNADPEEKELYGYEYITVFPRDTMVTYDNKTDASNQTTVTINTNKIDISAVREKGNWYTPDDFKGEKTDIDMKVDLVETYYTATEIGTYYDFINKKTHKRNSYEYHENTIKTEQLHSIDGVASLTFTLEKNMGYKLNVSCVDGKGLPIYESYIIYDSRYYDDYEYAPWKYFDYYSLDTDQIEKIGYKDGENVQLSMKRNDLLIKNTDSDKVLYIQYRKGMLGYQLSNDTTYSFLFSKDYIPDLSVMAIYFDGKYMKSTGFCTVMCNREEFRLNIDIKPNESTYRPGDTAEFQVHVTDASGKARSGEVLFSIVDEAFFALEDQYVNLLDRIYDQSVSRGYLGGSIPYTNTLEDFRYYGGGECGEGGDEAPNVRSNFKDTAAFETITTDENGNGSYSVKLPDNLTKWRVTFLGLTDDLYAGSGKMNIDTRLPYFINTVFSDTFITGDKPILQVRSFGTAIEKGSPVTYEVKVDKDGVLWHEYKSTSIIGQRSAIPFDVLEEGKYTYTVIGKYATYQDAIQLTFEVLPSYIEQTKTNFDVLSENIQFPNIKWPANISFYNAEARLFWDDLFDLAFSYGQRIDCLIAKKQARQIIKEHYGDWFYVTQSDDVSKYQLYNGGIALLPYDNANPVLTAKICSLGDPSFNYEDMKSYFYGIIQSQDALSTDIAASYWGLALLKEPILLSLDELDKSQNLAVTDKLYIALAYAEIGSYENASKIYQQMTSYIKQDDGRAYLVMDGYDSDDIQEATSLIALLSQKIGTAEKHKFFAYVSVQYSTDILTNAMRLSTIKSNIKALKVLSSFTYELDGTTQTVALNGVESYGMTLTAEKLSRIRFSNISGNITVATNYRLPLGEISQSDQQVTIQRSYSDKQAISQTSFHASDYIRVSLNVSFSDTAPIGYYLVEDYLPAAFRYVSSYSAENVMIDNSYLSWYPHEVFQQKVSFFVYHNKNSSIRSIQYYVRAINSGEYTADYPSIINLDTNIIGYGTKTKVTVE